MSMAKSKWESREKCITFKITPKILLQGLLTHCLLETKIAYSILFNFNKPNWKCITESQKGEKEKETL